jgi:hypothetical protein
MPSLEEELAAEMEASPAAPAAPASLESIQALGKEVNVLDERISKGEELLKELKARKNAILSKELVDALDSTGMEDFSVDGRKFEVGPYYHASIPKEKADEAHDWLEKHDAGDLIKYELIITFPKDCEEEAASLERYVRERYQMAEVEKKRGVPWARLTSWLKELWESTDVSKVLPPLELMGATVGRVVKIKEKKKL